MIYARHNEKYRITARILAEHLAGLSEAEFLHEIAEIFHGGGPVGYVVSTRLLSIATKCKANEEVSE